MAQVNGGFRRCTSATICGCLGFALWEAEFAWVVPVPAEPIPNECEFCIACSALETNFRHRRSPSPRGAFCDCHEQWRRVVGVPMTSRRRSPPMLQRAIAPCAALRRRHGLTGLVSAVTAYQLPAQLPALMESALARVGNSAGSASRDRATMSRPNRPPRVREVVVRCMVVVMGLPATAMIASDAAFFGRQPARWDTFFNPATTVVQRDAPVGYTCDMTHHQRRYCPDVASEVVASVAAFSTGCWTTPWPVSRSQGQQGVTRSAANLPRWRPAGPSPNEVPPRAASNTARLALLSVCSVPSNTVIPKPAADFGFPDHLGGGEVDAGFDLVREPVAVRPGAGWVMVQLRPVAKSGNGSRLRNA